MEGVEHPVHKLAKKTKWLQSAKKRMESKGTVGLFGKKAAAAGESTREYAQEKAGAPGVLGKEARFAKNAQKW